MKEAKTKRLDPGEPTIDGIALSEYFKYHPLMSPERIEKHAELNAAALEFAQILFKVCDNSRMRHLALDCIQQARMFGNQGITLDDIKD